MIARRLRNPSVSSNIWDDFCRRQVLFKSKLRFIKKELELEILCGTEYWSRWATNRAYHPISLIGTRGRPISWSEVTRPGILYSVIPRTGVCTKFIFPKTDNNCIKSVELQIKMKNNYLRCLEERIRFLNNPIWTLIGNCWTVILDTAFLKSLNPLLKWSHFDISTAHVRWR